MACDLLNTSAVDDSLRSLPLPQPPHPEPLLAEVASAISKKMTPVLVGRSRDREEFCARVLDRAKKITTECVEDKDFRRCFDDTNPSGIRFALNAALKSDKRNPMTMLDNALTTVEHALSDYPLDHENDPLLVMVFDEISSLLDNDKGGRYVALNRIISCISQRHRVWYFFLSTESKLGEMLPPDGLLGPGPKSAEFSYRGHYNLRRYSPFTEFASDIPDFKDLAVNILDPETALSYCPSFESMRLFASLLHMARFGRPLWGIYTSEKELIKVSKVKLIGGAPAEYNPEDPNQVFAVLSVRLFLDLVLANPKSLPLAQIAVNQHMRILDSVEPENGIMYTTTPSEPILANAAMHHLLSAKNKWQLSLKTFTRELLNHGLIEKGRKGELYSRLILTLAHDRIESQIDFTAPIFTVHDFLKSLFAEPHHKAIDRIDRDILEAKMNFLSFTSTSENLTPSTFKLLSYLLLRRCCALQLAPQQPTFDQLLPFYCGNLDEPFDPDQVGVIFVQVKYRKQKSTPGSILGESFFNVNGPPPREVAPSSRPQSTIFNSGVKSLFLLFDLGIDPPESVNVSYSKCSNPRIWAIDSKGHDTRTFGCLEGLSHEVDLFFRDVMTSSRSGHIAITHFKDQLLNAKKYAKICDPDEDVAMSDPFVERKN